MLALYKRVQELGLSCFFISARSESQRISTERNLLAAGFDGNNHVILEPFGSRFPTVKDFKTSERRKIAEEGYTIILNIGDQPSDVEGGYAEKYFLLPNPYYYYRIR